MRAAKLPFMARAELGSLRLSRSDKERLMTAIVFSLCLHLAIWGSFEVGKKFGWWTGWHLPVWLQKIAQINTPPKVLAEAQQQPQIFIDVDQSDPVPPKKTIFYSDQNSHVASVDSDKNSNLPKLNGKRPDTFKTEDIARLSKAQASPPPSEQLHPSPEKTSAEKENPSSPLNLGDVKVTKPAENPNTANQKPAPQQPPRPRTLKEAMEQKHLPGVQMKLNGGAHARIQAAFDVAKSSFGDYDRGVIDAVTEHWYNLLDKQNFAMDRTGQVAIRFKLEYDGTVRDVQVLQSNVGDLWTIVCQAAIEDSAPFGKWPDDMRREIGANYREITFTFNYY